MKETGKQGGIKSILVPRPGSDLPLPGAKPKVEEWDSINNDAWINNLFASINHKKLLCMSNGSAMAPGGIIHKLIGPHSIGLHSDDRLNGEFDVGTLTDIEVVHWGFPR